MPRWLPALRRPPKPEPRLVAALEESFGIGGVSLLKASSSFGGVVALVRTGKRTLPRRGQEKLLKSYAEMPWVRAVVGKIAESIASTEWFVLRSKKVNGDAAAAARFYSKASPSRRKRLRKQMELVELPGHALLDLLESGNEFHTGQTLDELTQAHLELVGEAFLLKERNGRGQPKELYCIPPSWVVDCPHPGRAERTFTLRVDGQETQIPATEMIWMKKPDPWAPYDRGVGTGRSLGDELDTDEYAAKHMKAWFVNGAIPDLLVSADGLGPTDTKRLEEDWLSKQQGFWNRFKPYFVGRKLQVDKLTSSFQEMGLGQLRKDQRDVIIHTWGVAPEMFGITENSNRANITGAFYQFARWVLVPRLELRRVFLQTRLVPDFDPALILDYESPVEEDATHRLEVMRTASWAFTADEWREEAGRPEIEGGKGKVYGVPFSLIFTDELGEGGAWGSQEPAASAGASLAAKASVPAGALGEKLPPEAEQIIAEVIEAIDADMIDDALRPILADAVLGFGAATLNDLLPGISFDVNDPAVVEFLKHGREAEIVDANATTQQDIRTSLSEGFEAGESMASLQSRVEEVFGDAVGTRSHVIARTETVSSANWGALEAVKQSGLGYKSWLAVADDATRDSHAALGQVPPIPVNEDFVDPLTGDSAPAPGQFGIAEQDIQCRCSVLGEAAPAQGESPTSRLETDEKRAAAWRSFESARLPYERAMKASVKRAFGKQEKAAKAALREPT